MLYGIGVCILCVIREGFPRGRIANKKEIATAGGTDFADHAERDQFEDLTAHGGAFPFAAGREVFQRGVTAPLRVSAQTGDMVEHPEEARAEHLRGVRRRNAGRNRGCGRLLDANRVRVR